MSFCKGFHAFKVQMVNLNIVLLQIEISKKFFTSVQLPYSVIRGEQLVIQATVFNYSPEPVYVSINLSLHI